MKICYPDYGGCIANLACSLMAYYGIQPPNPTLPQADELLKKNYKNIVLILLDGMGVNVVEKHLAGDGFFRQNLRAVYSSTFPPTTVAATTAIRSGLYPNQSAWLGWVGYFAELDRNVVYFFNQDNDTRQPIEEMSVTDTYVPYQKLVDRIAQTGVKAAELMAWSPPFPQTYQDMCEQIAGYCSEEGRHFVYAYWDQPDKRMHEKGVGCDGNTAVLKELEQQTLALSRKLQDTLLIVTADHGMTDSRCAVLGDHPEIASCLIRTPSIESRAVNFFVKPECSEQFEKAFNSAYGDAFILMKKQDVLGSHLFGKGKNHPRFESMLGDYLAAATGSLTIRTCDKGYIGEHAGLLQDEMIIPLITVEAE